MRETVVPLSGTDAGRAPLTVGAGGDRTMELDRAAEAEVFSELEQVAARGERFSILSEEAGLRDLGAEYPLVLVDPVDGSLNAKQGVPFFAVMLALLDGPNVGDTLAGCVVNLINGDSWTAVRGEGGRHRGSALAPISRDGHAKMELVALETTPHAYDLIRGLVRLTPKIRILGSMALAIAHTAIGSFDAFCAPAPVRVFDMAASLLILAEAGGVATDLQGRALTSLQANLETRTSILCAPTPELHAAALRALAAGR